VWEGIKQRHAEEGNLQAALGRPIAIFLEGEWSWSSIHLSVPVCVDRHQDQVEVQKTYMEFWTESPKPGSCPPFYRRIIIALPLRRVGPTAAEPRMALA